LLICGALLASGVACLLAARFYSHFTAALLAGAVGGAFGIAKLAFDSMAQRGLPRHVQGRRFARWETAFQLAWVAGALLPVGVKLPVTPVLTLLGLASLGFGVAYAVDVSRVRRGGGPAPVTARAPKA
jgi:hypothetical protein